MSAPAELPVVRLMTLEEALAEVEAKILIMAEVMVEEGITLAMLPDGFTSDFLRSHMSVEADAIIYAEVVAGHGDQILRRVEATIRGAGAA